MAHALVPVRNPHIGFRRLDISFLTHAVYHSTLDTVSQSWDICSKQILEPCSPVLEHNAGLRKAPAGQRVSAAYPRPYLTPTSPSNISRFHLPGIFGENSSTRNAVWDNYMHYNKCHKARIERPLSPIDPPDDGIDPNLFSLASLPRKRNFTLGGQDKHRARPPVVKQT